MQATKDQDYHSGLKSHTGLGARFIFLSYLAISLQNKPHTTMNTVHCKPRISFHFIQGHTGIVLTRTKAKH